MLHCTAPMWHGSSTFAKWLFEKITPGMCGSEVASKELNIFRSDVWWMIDNSMCLFGGFGGATKDLGENQSTHSPIFHRLQRKSEQYTLPKDVQCLMLQTLRPQSILYKSFLVNFLLIEGKRKMFAFELFCVFEFWSVYQALHHQTYPNATLRYLFIKRGSIMSALPLTAFYWTLLNWNTMKHCKPGFKKNRTGVISYQNPTYNFKVL